MQAARKKRSLHRQNSLVNIYNTLIFNKHGAP